MMTDSSFIRIKILAAWERELRKINAMPALMIGFDQEGGVFALTGVKLDRAALLAMLDMAGAAITDGSVLEPAEGGG